MFGIEPATNERTTFGHHDFLTSSRAWHQNNAVALAFITLAQSSQADINNDACDRTRDRPGRELGIGNEKEENCRVFGVDSNVVSLHCSIISMKLLEPLYYSKAKQGRDQPAYPSLAPSIASSCRAAASC